MKQSNRTEERGETEHDNKETKRKEKQLKRQETKKIKKQLPYFSVCGVLPCWLVAALFH